MSNSSSGSVGEIKMGVKNSRGKKKPESFSTKAASSSLFAVENYKVNL